ncbi:MAG: 30S ribosomal protein S12 methylthiotransferase RimO [Eggerthellaceae bacterium]|nr:30S ribosomal protein S12 methylthiotransferase RimO [Eggerthellaceae bacterium]
MINVPQIQPRAYISLITMGCPKNEVDSLSMRKNLENAGFAFIDDVEESDIAIVNTCSFLQAAVEENIDLILEISSLDRFVEHGGKIVVAGCMPSRYGVELNDALPEADAFVPCNEENNIVDVVEKLLTGHIKPSKAPFGESKGISASSMLPPLSEGPASAYIKIADGCNRFCSFCAIPYIRGRFHSFTYEEICADVDDAFDSGAREMVLIAQDTGIWGSDLSGGRDLAWLVSHLSEDYPEALFRVMYLEPDGVTDAYLHAVASHDNVCSYFDIPMQHCVPEVLKAMNRHGSANEFLSLIEKIRKQVPDAAIRTTIIAGFPGETDAQFSELLDFIEEAEFDYVGVFAYSQEDGTRAATLPDQVDEDTKVARAQAIRDLADSISTARTANRVGQVLDVLIEGAEEDGQLFGRAYFQAPEVDGSVYVDSGEIGDIVSVRLIDSLFYELEGEVV